MRDTRLDTAAARCDEASRHCGAGCSGWFGDVLVGVDGSPTGRDAIALGEALRDPSGRLTLAHVLLSQAPSYRNFHATPAWANSRRMLERESEASGIAAELTGMASASVGGGLHQLADDCGADLLVVGSCSRGSVGRLLRGDDTRGSLSSAGCAVAIAPHGYAERSREIKTIGVAYNDTPESEAALAAARSLAARLRASVQALTVVSLAAAGPGAWGALDVGWAAGIEAIEQAARDRLRSLDGVDVRVAFGPPGDELVAFGDEVDLLVVGSRSFGPLRRLILGSTSMHLARDVRSPLLVLPRPAVVGDARDES